MSRLLSTLALIWRLARPYFFSEDRWAGRILLGAVIALELLIVAINVMLNQWNNRFYNALQERNWDNFVWELLFFCALAAAFIVLAVYKLYLNQWLQIRWRRWMTRQYLDRWLANANHYRMQLLGDAADNPDQRISEDINLFIDRTLTLTVGLLSAIVTLFSFIVILWTLSAAAPLLLFGTSFVIPGYLVWAALLYAMVGTALTHLIGWPLVGLNFRQQRFEADFRFNLVRVRENSEQIALLRGESDEREQLINRFGRVVGNFMQIMLRTKKLTFLTASYTQVATIFPFIVISPAYFAGTIQLGGLMQTASAFTSVQTALSFFVDAYRQLAEWRAVIARLDGFNVAVESAQAAAIGEAGDRGRVAHRQGRHPDRRPCGAPAARRHAGRRRRPRHCGRRARAGHRLIRRGKIDLVPGDRGHLAVRRRHHPRPQRRQGHDAAAAALFFDRHACRRSHLSGGAGNVQHRSAGRGHHRGRAARARGAAHGGGALEPNAVARRAAAPGHCPRHPASAGLSFPRRSHGVARRIGGGRNLPTAG